MWKYKNDEREETKMADFIPEYKTGLVLGLVAFIAALLFAPGYFIHLPIRADLSSPISFSETLKVKDAIDEKIETEVWTYSRVAWLLHALVIAAIVALVSIFLPKMLCVVASATTATAAK